MAEPINRSTGYENNPHIRIRKATARRLHSQRVMDCITNTHQRRERAAKGRADFVSHCETCIGLLNRDHYSATNVFVLSFFERENMDVFIAITRPNKSGHSKFYIYALEEEQLNPYRALAMKD